MTNLKKSWLLTPLAILGVACGKAATDDTLKSDLALASQAQQYTPQPVVSPTEQGLAGSPYTTPAQRAPSGTRTQTVRRSTSTRSSGRSAGSSAGQVVYQPAPQPVEKHTNRDAAIGAATGAVIGAVSSRDKVRGGLIGAAAGAILGGVIGNNVDVKRPN
jgi:Glycine zipper